MYSEQKSLIEMLDCCGVFRNLRNYLNSTERKQTLLSSYKQSIRLYSFAEKLGIVKEMTHKFDADLLKLYEKADFSNTDPSNSDFNLLASYNPPFQIESQTFKKLAKLAGQQGRMLRFNSLLLSRLFIHNAFEHRLPRTVPDSQRDLRVLDIGCGYALNLPGVYAYFGAKVNYTGIDTDASRITWCRKSYKNKFPNVSFKCQDANKLLLDENFFESFDIVLIQHPDLTTSKKIQDSFKSIFQNVDKVLAEGGTVYCTFYYPDEVVHFKNKIARSLNRIISFNEITENSAFLSKLGDTTKLNPDGTPTAFCPEQFSLISLPKNTLEETYSPRSKKIN